MLQNLLTNMENNDVECISNTYRFEEIEKDYIINTRFWLHLSITKVYSSN